MAKSKLKKVETLLVKAGRCTSSRVSQMTGIPVKDVQKVLRELLAHGEVQVDKSGTEWVWFSLRPSSPITSKNVIEKQVNPPKQKQKVEKPSREKAGQVIFEALRQLTLANPKALGFTQDEIAEKAGNPYKRKYVGRILSLLGGKGQVGFRHDNHRTKFWSVSLPSLTARQRVFDFVKQNGSKSGITVLECSEGLGILVNNARYHLVKLAQEGHLVRLGATHYRIAVVIKPTRHRRMKKPALIGNEAEVMRYLSLLDTRPKTVKQVTEAYYDKYGVFRSRTTVQRMLRELESKGKARGSASRKGVQSVWVRVPECKATLQTEAGNA